MQQPWFDAHTGALLGACLGSAIGIYSGVFGTLCSLLIPRGRARGLIIGMLWFGTIFGAGLLIAGIVAWCQGQPYAVWYILGFPGLISTILFSVFIPVIRKRYAVVEIRKSQAADL
jgi:hypothetical protein